MKIPQYFFDTKGATGYYKLLDSVFRKPYKPNDIDELIIELDPEHIITTNYDHLIEDVVNPNVSNYTVIKNDKDLLEQDGRRYIIKMHGDIDNVEELVLKEDDYLKYSQNHIIIETYIKSLLVDKTFLFVGYSLNDNNLSLIMSYIDYFVKDKGIEKSSSHYLVVNSISKPERETLYWKNKGVELVDLSELSTDMIHNAKCTSLKSEQGKTLYTFLKYLQNDKLPFYNDKRVALQKSLLNSLKQFEAFSFISYKDLLKSLGFSRPVSIINSSLNFTDKNEYELLKSIFQEKTDEVVRIKKSFLKAGLFAIQCSRDILDSYVIEKELYEEDVLFWMSLNNQYIEILDKVNNSDDKLEKAYYYSLIYRTKHELTELMSDIKSEIESFNYQKLALRQKVMIAIFEFNNISLRLLNYNADNKELWDKLTILLDNASNQSSTFGTIKKMSGKNEDILSELNNRLIKHEEYYMEKSSKTKWGGTIYGDLFDLQSVVYDYYQFYKKNHLMLDWFNNVEKVCEPYIKAILCTYYPDEYQFSNNGMGRTQVEPYPINLMDIDMIVKHTKFKNFENWISYYKVFEIQINESVDVAETFENFCISMRTFWNLSFEEHLKVFSKLISLVELTKEQKHRILKAFITLVKPDERIGINMLRNSLNALWIYVQKHYDSSDENCKELLTLMINEQILRDPLDGKAAYEKLIEKLSVHADNNAYSICENLISNCNENRKKVYYMFVFRNILLDNNSEYWLKQIENSIDNNCSEELYTYIESDILMFNESVKCRFINMLVKDKENKISNGIIYPDPLKNDIRVLLILLLIGKISNLNDIQFLNQYVDDSAYLDFLFAPDSFDYSKITTADYMWCNFINNENYREIILKHKSEFWSEEDEKRIRLGFGSDFENRVTYKYLFD